MLKFLLAFFFFFSIGFTFSQNSEFNSKIDKFNKDITLKYLGTLKGLNDSSNLQLLKNEITTMIEIIEFEKLLDKHKFSVTKDKLTYIIDSLKQKTTDYETFFDQLEFRKLQSLAVVKNYYDSLKNTLEPVKKNEFQNSETTPSLEDTEIYNYFSIENIIILCLLIILLILNKKNSKLFKENESFERKFSKINSTENHNDQNNRELENVNRSLVSKNEEIKELERIIASLKSNSDTLKQCAENEILTETKEHKNNIIYFRSPLSDGNFSIDHQSVNSEFALSMFEFSISKSGNQAEFKFCGDEKIQKLVINHPDQSIEKVCDYENSRNEYKSQISTIYPGKAELKGDKWVVIQKAKIKFS